MIAYDKIALTLHTWLESCQDGEASAWEIEPYSPRPAHLLHMPACSRQRGLLVAFGKSQGDAIYLGRRLHEPDIRPGLHVRCYAYAADRAAVYVGLVLTTRHYQPWLVYAPVLAPLMTSTTLRFDVRSSDPARLAAVDRMNIVILSSAGEGFVVLEDIAFV